MTNDLVQRFFGGPPLSVIIRLILLSILVGVVLAAIGFDPWNIIHSIRRLIDTIWNMGWDAVNWVWRYFLLGAVLVIPIWLIVRLARVPSGRDRDPTRSP
ncbi:MAG TPA: DUF6460 domain-containing protein [Xanthobacteraceae bacterium]|jgi:hypothetical protein|nr:DUF6460 domain-containing protein [Xanthobacteraceae bacterium]